MAVWLYRLGKQEHCVHTQEHRNTGTLCAGTLCACIYHDIKIYKQGIRQESYSQEDTDNLKTFRFIKTRTDSMLQYCLSLYYNLP